jgi:hypothetical protein
MQKTKPRQPGNMGLYQIAVTVPAIAAAMDSNIDQHS